MTTLFSQQTVTVQSDNNLSLETYTKSIDSQSDNDVDTWQS